MLRADPNADCSDVRAQASAKLGEVECKIAQLQQIQAALKTLIARCPGHGGLTDCSILDALTQYRVDRPGPSKDVPASFPSTRRKGHRR